MENYSFLNVKNTEKIDGVIYDMFPTGTPRHNRIIDNIYGNMFDYFRKKKCKANTDGLAVYFSEENYIIPDLTITCEPTSFSEKGYHGIPSLVAEVISPSSIKHDRETKFELYQRYAVPEYWIVTPNIDTIEQYWLIEGKYKLQATYFIPKGSPDEPEIINQIIIPKQFPDLSININDIFDYNLG